MVLRGVLLRHWSRVRVPASPPFSKPGFPWTAGISVGGGAAPNAFGVGPGFESLPARHFSTTPAPQVDRDQHPDYQDNQANGQPGEEMGMPLQELLQFFLHRRSVPSGNLRHGTAPPVIVRRLLHVVPILNAHETSLSRGPGCPGGR